MNTTSPPPEALSIGALKEAIIAATDLEGAWGVNLSVDKQVLLRVYGHVSPLVRVSASFHEGRFVLMLDGE